MICDSRTSSNSSLNRNISYQIIFPLNKHVVVTTMKRRQKANNVCPTEILGNEYDKSLIIGGRYNSNKRMLLSDIEIIVWSLSE